MKRLCAMLVALLIAAPVWADEGDDLGQIPSCGSVQTKTDIYQSAFKTSPYIDGYTQSQRNIDGCLSKLRVEAYILGFDSGVATNESIGPAVTVDYSVPAPRWDTYTGRGKHWLINFGAWIWYGYSSDTVTLVKPPDPPPDCSVYNGGGSYYTWDANAGQCVEITSWSPIIVDAARDGYHLTSAADGVRFDLNGDGVAEQIAWTRAGSDDAFLAMDRNGNGVIDDGSELFGDRTPAYPGQQLHALNGFDALGFLETPDYGSSYGDGVLNGRDAPFGRLLLWTDRNHNGISEPGELVPVGGAGIVALGTQSREQKKRDGFGNEFRLRSTVTWADGEQTPMYDVWLQVQR